MSQTALPVSDVSNFGWTPTPVYQQIDQPVPTDTTFVTNAPNGTSSFEVQLAPLITPGPGSEVLTVRMAGSGQVLVKLLQNRSSVDVQIASWLINVNSSAFTSYPQTLTTAQAASIIWPSNPTVDPLLRVQVTVVGGSSSSVSSSSSSGSSGSQGSQGSRSGSSSSSGGPSGCFCAGLSETLTVTLSGFTGTCAGFNGSYTVTWNGSNWVYQDPSCTQSGTTPCLSQMVLLCPGSDGTANFEVSGLCHDAPEWGAMFTLSGTCSPLDYSGSASVTGSCCNTTITATVTE